MEHPLISYNVQLPKSNKLFWNHFFWDMKFGGIPSRTSTDIDCNLRQVGLLYPQDECSGKNRKNNSKVVFEHQILVHLIIGWI